MSTSDPEERQESWPSSPTTYNTKISIIETLE